MVAISRPQIRINTIVTTVEKQSGNISIFEQEIKMIDWRDIPDRITVRLNDDEKMFFFQLSKFINEDDLSKIIKFALSTSKHHIKFVTEALVDPNWDVIFQRKRKTQKIDRRLY